MGVNELADGANVSASSISNFETGKRAGAQFATIAAVAQKLAISLDWIATGAGEPPVALAEPDSPAARARAAAIALGYPPAAIEAGIKATEGTADAEDPWEILGQIRAESRRPTPARSPYGLPLTTTHRPVGSTDVQPPPAAGAHVAKPDTHLEKPRKAKST